MSVIELDRSDRSQVREFLGLPESLYRACPQWVPPLTGELEGLLRARSRHPYYRHSQAAFFLVRQGGRPVGRLAVLDHRRYNEHNRERTAFFYLFECQDDTGAARELFEAGGEWARRRGLERMIGPKGFTPLDGGGLLVEGFEHRPAFGMPYNPPYYPALVEACGFRLYNETVSGYLSRQTVNFPERVHALASRVAERRGLQVVSYRNRAELRALVPHLQGLYNEALEGTSGNYPLSDEDVRGLANQLLWFADPTLIKLVRKDDRIVGFLFAYPDISAALQRTRGRLLPFGWISLLRELGRTEWININGAGMVEEFRGSGGTAILFSQVARSLLARPGFRHAEVVQIGTDNEAMQREMRNFGIDFNKKHRLYQREL